MPRRDALLAAHRALFAALVAFTLWSALRPGPETPAQLSDKVLHLIAFYVLTLSAACAAPRAPLWALVAAMAGFGAAIEVLQFALPTGRTASLADWLADLAGTAAAAAALLVARWRSRP